MLHEDKVLTKQEQRAIVKRLLKYAGVHKRLLAFACTFLVIGVGAELLSPYLVKIFIDSYVTPGVFPAGELTGLAAIFAAATVLSAVMVYFHTYWFQRIALKSIQQIRVDVFSSVEGASMRFYDQTPSGALVSRITNDTERIRELYMEVLSTFIQNGVFLVGVLAAMFFLDVRLAAAAILIMPLLLMLMMLYRRYSARYYGEMSGKLSRLNTKINESLQGMSVIQLFRQESRMKQEFSGINDAHYEAGLKSMKIDGLLLRPAIDLVSVLALVGVLSYFGILSMEGAVQVGVIYAFVNYFERFFEPVNEIMQQMSLYQQSIVSAGRVFHLMDVTGREAAVVRGRQTGEASESGEIEFDHVTFSYDGEHPVLRDISLSVKEGETVAIVGHTGSGKSSIINLLLRFYEHDAGTIFLGGKDLQRWPEEALRRHVGLVLQDPFLFTGTVRENIAMYNHGLSDEQVRQAAAFVGADQFIEALPGQYSEQVGERGSSFSNGEKQLITFARTVAHDPKVLVLDEATANIDSESEAVIQQALANLVENRTTIMIAHRLSTIRHADQIIVLHQGEIAERGTHRELLASGGLYEKMHRLQHENEEVL